MTYYSPTPMMNMAQPASNIDHMLRGRVRDLERRVGQLELANGVLMQLVKKGLKLSDEDLETRMKELDMRDGVQDGRISVVPLKCPSCSRVSSSKHWKCLYCGLKFEREY